MSHLRCFAAISSLLVLSSCGTPSPAPSEPDEQQSHEGHPSHADCPPGFECTETEICGSDGCVPFNNVGWIDTNDAGDDPFGPGCHWAYWGDPTCHETPTFHRGDRCISETTLHEYTDSTCHVLPPVDEKDHDCDKLCKDQGAGAGRCVTVPNVCAGNDSAKCECVTVEP